MALDTSGWFLESCEGASALTAGGLQNTWTDASLGSLVAGQGPRGGNALSLPNTATAFAKGLPSHTYGYLHMAVRYTTLPSAGSTNAICGIRSASLPHLQVYVDSTGALKLARNTTEIASVAGVFTLNQWINLELIFYIHASAGYAYIFLNGSATPAISFSGNTAASADPASQLRMNYSSTIGAAGTKQVADLVYQPGYTSTTPRGVLELYERALTADGTYTALTPSTGSTHYTLISDNNAATYNSSGTSGASDSYAFQDKPGGTGDILVAQAWAQCAAADVGTANARAGFRSSGSDEWAAGVGLTTSNSTVYATKSDWASNAQFNDAEILVGVP